MDEDDAVLRKKVAHLLEQVSYLTKAYDNIYRHCGYLEDVVDNLIFQKMEYPLPRIIEEQHKKPEVISQKINVLNKMLHSQAPAAYELWKKLQAQGETTYNEKPTESCSVVGNSGAEKFAAFVKDKIHGITLDIGCGVVSCPIYLTHHPRDMIIGIDPIPDNGNHEFEYVQGYAEFLPFANASFDTVIMATSLDHALLPYKVISEVLRVLRPHGRLIVWEGTHYTLHDSFMQYNPHAKHITAFDDHHMFRFSNFSLFLCIKSMFNIVDFVRNSRDSIMLELSPKHKDAAQ